MKNDKNTTVKHQWLKSNGVLYKAFEKVKDELFQKHDFFDPCDLIQVKYEMIRRVEKDGWTISKAANVFGFSRLSFYKIKQLLGQEGLWGLIPRKRGPKGAYKLTDKVMEFVESCMKNNDTLRAPELGELIKEHFGFSVHSRSIERALERKKKQEREENNSNEK
ncbi:hypothetical protein ES703_78202 [subsurface metagenome]